MSITRSLLFLLVLSALAACASQTESSVDPDRTVAVPSNPFGTAVLSEGSTGPEVAALQRTLNGLLTPSPELAVNGAFGPQTEAAVRRLQEQAGLSVDGRVRPKTMVALGADVDPYFAESSGISSSAGPEIITRNIIQDRNGAFWLATWHGVMHYDGTTFTNLTNRDGLRRYRVFSALEDRRGNIWLGTIGAGVYRFDGASYTNFTAKDGMVDDTVVSMWQSPDDTIWFGGMGLTKFDGSRFTAFDEDDGFTSADVNSISQSPDGTLWLGTRGALFRYDGTTFVNMTEQLGLDIPSYIPTLVDRKGHLWFAGSSGLYHYDGTQLRHVFQPACFSLLEDSRGHIWFSGGTMRGQGMVPGTSVLNRFDPADGLDNLVAARDQFEVKTGAMFGLTEDRDGTIWFGTGRGIGRIDGGTVQYPLRQGRTP